MRSQLLSPKQKKSKTKIVSPFWIVGMELKKNSNRICSLCVKCNWLCLKGKHYNSTVRCKIISFKLWVTYTFKNINCCRRKNSFDTYNCALTKISIKKWLKFARTQDWIKWSYSLDVACSQYFSFNNECCTQCSWSEYG